MDNGQLHNFYELLSGRLNERDRRLVFGALSKGLGRGSISRISSITGMSRDTISKGIKELESPEICKSTRIRKEGAGRKKIVDTDPTLLTDLDKLIDPMTRGDPESPLRWTCLSLRNLANGLNKMGHKISHSRVGDALHEMGYSLQANRKTIEGGNHKDRNAQFENINSKTISFMEKGQPIISVDTKKKELIGNFKNSGKELRPKGNPQEVLVYDFIIPELGRANPYGVYDIQNNEGWVNLGKDNDTSAFAVESIRRWWNLMGKNRFPNAKNLLITADCGGSNGYRIRLWKVELQKFADETGLKISVSHFPPGTSKWNKIEHRLFSFISMNWRGKPLITHQVMIDLISSTKTSTGLTVKCELDTNKYPKGIKISDKELSEINLIKDDFHGEWNYSIIPHQL